MRKLLFIFLLLPLIGNCITPVFTCGFECGVNGVGDGYHIGGFVSGSFNTSTVRSGARSVRVNPTATIGQVFFYSIASSNLYVARIYVRFATLPDKDCAIFYSPASSNKIGVFFKNSDSKLYGGIDVSGVTLSSTGFTVTTDTWYRISLRTNTSANPWLVDVSIDGTALAQLSSAQSATTTNSLYCGPGQLTGSTNITADVYYDDFILSTTSGDHPIGAGYVNHFVPVTPDGTHSGLTANDFERTLTGTDILNSTTDSYQLLDDVPLESGSSVDWVNMVAPVASSYTEHIFGPASGISTPTVAPRMVSVIIGIHAAGTGNYNAEWLLNDNGTTTSIFTASAEAGTTSVIYKNLNLADPPSAASTWTLSGNGNFNNIRVRFGPTGTVDANPDVYFDCAMIEAEFEEAQLTVPGTPGDKRHTTLGVGLMAVNNFKEFLNRYK